MNRSTLKRLPAVLVLCYGVAAAEGTTVTLHGDVLIGALLSNYSATGQTPINATTGSNTAVNRGFQMMNDSSNFGISVKQDLGGGMYAGVGLESGVVVQGHGEVDAGGGLFSRDAELKFGGAFGEFYAGYVLSPIGLQLLLAADPWYWNGNPGGMGWQIQQANYFQNNFLRTASTFGFRSANYGGFTFQIAGSPKLGAQVNGGGTGRTFGGTVTYHGGPLMLGAGYEQSDGGLLNNLGTTNRVADIVGGYDFGVVHPSFSYTSSKVDNVSYSSYVLAATAPMGPQGLLKAAYGHLSGCSAACAPLSGVTGAYSRASLGYQHNINAQTNIFGVLSTSKASGLSSLNSFEIGLEHSF